MTFLLGTLAAGAVGFLTLLCGYGPSVFLARQTLLNRLALASLLGLAWIVLFASIAGAGVPLSTGIAWLGWAPAIGTLAMTRTRQQLVADFSAVLKSSGVIGAMAGVLALWLALLLPFLIYPDLAFFDGKTNHDNFFWCIGAEYLQHHDYLAIPAKNPDHPLFNLIWSFCGWQPAWARMGSEGYLALASATFGLTPIRLYNFLTSVLVIPWLLLSLAIARRLGLPRLNNVWLALICFCQPVLFFFIANGNLPNLLGALFSGGIWLVALLVEETRTNLWRLGLIAALFVHGIFASYPEILPFGLAPAGLLAIHVFFANGGLRQRMLLWLGGAMIAGACLNPVSTLRLWSGIQNSIVQAHSDAAWANIFDRITYAGYIPSLATLGVPTFRLYGIIGGLVASAVVLGSVWLLFRDSKQRLPLFLSFSGFLALLSYTLIASFGYGWQKSVQFSGVHFAVLFPALAAGAIQEYRQPRHRRYFALATMVATFGLLLHSTIGITAENLKFAGTKGLTNEALALHYRVEAELPDHPIQVDGSTFPAAFFQGMWSTRIFPKNPLAFIPREDRPGGYLWESVKAVDPKRPVGDPIYFVSRDWAEAFDYAEKPLMGDRVGVLLSHHNLVTALVGFYRATGVPQLAKPDFSLTIQAHADGWVEFILVPRGTTQNCELHATVASGGETRKVDVNLEQGRLVARFPLRGKTRNVISAKISGAPLMESGNEESEYPLQVVSIKSGAALDGPAHGL